MRRDGMNIFRIRNTKSSWNCWSQFSMTCLSSIIGAG